MTLTAIFVSLRPFYVSCTSSTSSPGGFLLPMCLDNGILICENSFENAILEDMIVGVAQASPAGSRGLVNRG